MHGHKSGTVALVSLRQRGKSPVHSSRYLILESGVVSGAFWTSCGGWSGPLKPLLLGNATVSVTGLLSVVLCKGNEDGNVQCGAAAQLK